MTLLELVVALAILGLVLGITGLALASLRPAAEAETVRAQERARAEAIRTGQPVRIVSDSPPGRLSDLFLPDARAIGPGVDPLTGAPRATR